MFANWRYLILLILIPFAACTPPKEAQSQPKLSYIVKFEEGVSESKQLELLDSLGLIKKRELSLIGAFVCVPKEGTSRSDPIIEGKKVPEIRYIEVDQPVYAD